MKEKEEKGNKIKGKKEMKGKEEKGNKIKGRKKK